MSTSFITAFDFNYLSDHRVVGINSLYGNGKSTLVEVLKNENENWKFITISVLSTTVENIEYCIVREIDQLLCSYGIFSNFISKIKMMLSQKYSFYVGELLFDDLAYEKKIKNFTNDILRLNKVVVLNFEDIDRIDNKTLLNKIFTICESLLKYEKERNSNMIKVIYQCNMEKLNSLFKGEDHYIEKFIPNYYTIDVLVDDVFENVLQKNIDKYKKIKEIESIGQTFNPELHEAIGSVVDENLGEKEIKEEYRKGYMIGDKVIRHSLVVVAN